MRELDNHSVMWFQFSPDCCHGMCLLIPGVATHTPTGSLTGSKEKRLPIIHISGFSCKDIGISLELIFTMCQKFEEY